MKHPKILLILLNLIVVFLISGCELARPAGSGDISISPPPLLTSQAIRAATQAAVPVLETLDDRVVSESDLPGDIQIDYPLVINSGSEDFVKVAIALADTYVSLEPMDFERKLIPPDATPVVGMLESDQAYIPIRDVMRVELSAGAFQVTNLSSIIQNIETDQIGEPTLWVWRIEPLSEEVNEQFLVIIVYRGEENIPVWQRAYQVRIAGPTPTPTTLAPTPTPAPTIPERLTDQLIDNSPVILTAVLGFVVSGIGFLYRTYKKRQEKIEALQAQSQTAQDTQEIEEKIATLQSIKWWQFWK